MMKPGAFSISATHEVLFNPTIMAMDNVQPFQVQIAMNPFQNQNKTSQGTSVLTPHHRDGHTTSLLECAFGFAAR